jgi:hypothetical protein
MRVWGEWVLVIMVGPLWMMVTAWVSILDAMQIITKLAHRDEGA